MSSACCRYKRPERQRIPTARPSRALLFYRYWWVILPQIAESVGDGPASSGIGIRQRENRQQAFAQYRAARLNYPQYVNQSLAGIFALDQATGGPPLK